MKSFFNCTILIFLLFLVPGCDSYVQEQGNGNIISENRKIDPFKRIDIDGNYEVYLKKSESGGMVITTDENLHQFIKSEVKRGVLKIESEKGLSSDEPVRIEISYEQIEEVKVSGAAIVRSSGVISGDYLGLVMSGAGLINFEVEQTALKITISGAGVIQLKGQVLEQSVEMSGAGVLKAYDLISKNCKIEISGVGGASIYVEKKLEASVSGVGGVSYRGNPQEVISDVSGLGKVSGDEDYENPKN